MFNFTWALCSWKTVKVKGILPPFCVWKTAYCKELYDLDETHECPLLIYDKASLCPINNELNSVSLLRSIRTKCLLSKLWLSFSPSFRLLDLSLLSAWEGIHILFMDPSWKIGWYQGKTFSDLLYCKLSFHPTFPHPVLASLVHFSCQRNALFA